jgi:multisubunit Na+/H+ antiporter MnhF subunit
VLSVRTVRSPQWSDLVVGSDETINVTRVQALFFTVIVAAFVVVRIIATNKIPDIPEGFLWLMGISNGVYVTAKFFPGGTSR